VADRSQKASQCKWSYKWAKADWNDWGEMARYRVRKIGSSDVERGKG